MTIKKYIHMKSIPKLENTVLIQHTINVPFSIDKVFNFFIDNNLSKYYKEISKGHDYFTLRNGNKLKVGSIIDCEESAKNQSIKHEYHLTEISENKRIAWCSKPSYTKIRLPWKTIESKSNTYVYYDFKNENDNTYIRLTIGIQFFKKIEIFLGNLFGLAPWKKHCIDEMEGLKKILLSQMS